MKNTFPCLFILFVLFTLNACTSSQTQSDTTETNTRELLPEPDKNAHLSYQNAADYGEDFLKSLSTQKGFSFQLIDDKFIIDQMDTVYFSTLLPLNKTITFTGKKNQNTAIALNVKRINYTTIEYRTEIVQFGKKSYLKEGTAMLSPMLFLGGESDETADGEGYGVDEYTEYGEGELYNSIRIGKINEADTYLVAKIIQNAPAEGISLSLEDCPVLRQK